MDRKLPKNAEIEQLILQSANARTCLQSEAARIRRKFDIPARIRGSLAEHPTSWLFGSLFSGLAASLLFSSRRKVAAKTKSRGMTGKLLGLALTAAQPVAKLWFSNQLSRWLQQLHVMQSTGRPDPRSQPKTQFP